MDDRYRKLLLTKKYIVRPGDTLWKIAGRFGTTVSEILANNPFLMKPHLIFPGQTIILPLQKKTCQYKPFPSQLGIDFSSIKYFCSEKERDIKLEQALIEEFNLVQEKSNLRYFYNKVDLNDDGRDEVFVHLVGPFVCGTGGCSAAIFKQENGEYILLSRFSLVRNPVIISNSKTKGYRDIIMFVSGGGIESFFAQVQYDVNSYPSNPSVQPKVKPGTKIEGIAIIADDYVVNPGIEL